MIKTNGQLLAEIAALPDPIDRTSLTNLLTNIVDSMVSQQSGVTYGKQILLKANGNTNIDTPQSNDGTIKMNNEGVVTTSIV
jgi:hypothetical protein